MPAQLSYSKKCLVLLAGFLVFTAGAWKLSFSKTLQLKQETDEKEKKISWLRKKEKDIPALEASMAKVEQLCQGPETVPLRDRLTAFISGFATSHGCTVTDIPAGLRFTEDQLYVETNLFTIEGRFSELLLLIHELEKTFGKTAGIASLRFYTTKQSPGKRKQLYLTLVTQSFHQMHTSTT